MQAILHCDSKWGIGKGNDLMFRLPKDMKFFKTQTTGKVVVMGSNTLLSFPNGKPLKNRTNIVLWPNCPDAKERAKEDGFILVESLPDLAFEIAKYPSEDVFVIGGAMMYHTLLPYCDKVFLTKVKEDGGAQVFFDNLDELANWKQVYTSEEQEDNGHIIQFTTYQNSSVKSLASLAFSIALEEIKKFDTIIIHRHTKPDGDAMGSQIGLKNIIKANFPEKKVYVVGDPSSRLAFMKDAQMDTILDSTYDNALAIILDCSASSLISNTRYTKAKKTLSFDHHLFCKKIADIAVMDSSYESCCGIITDFARESSLDVPDLAAEALFTGMVTDSGRFKYDSTSSRTFELAAFLRKRNFDISEIYNNLYKEDFSYTLNKAKFILKVKFTKNNVAYIYTTKEELKELNLDTQTAARAYVNVMGEIKDVDIWVNFAEDTDNSIACELRSSSFNINPIAVKYGGGGHAKASGATVKDKATAMQMLEDLNKLSFSKMEKTT